MTPVSDETMRRVAAALERLVLVIEARASSASPRPVEPPARVIPKGGRRAA